MLFADMSVLLKGLKCTNKEINMKGNETCPEAIYHRNRSEFEYMQKKSTFWIMCAWRVEVNLGCMQ